MGEAERQCFLFEEATSGYYVGAPGACVLEKEHRKTGGGGDEEASSRFVGLELMVSCIVLCGVLCSHTSPPTLRLYSETHISATSLRIKCYMSSFSLCK